MVKRFKDYLVEFSLNRALTHFNKKGYPVAVMTTFKGYKPHKENKKTNKQLEKRIRQFGFGLVKVKGAYKGEDDDVEFTEDSFIIISSANQDGELRNFCNRMSNKYDQEGYIFKSSDAVISVKDKKGKDIFGPFSNVTLKQLDVGYTKLKKRSFAFESAYINGNWIDRYAESGD